MEIGLVGEYIVALGADVAKRHVNYRINEYKLKRELKEYIERQRKYNDICTMAAECDFQGLIMYITQELPSDVEQRIFARQKETRRKAHEEIVSKAMIYSKVSTEESKKRVGRLISECLELVRLFFEKEKTISDYLLAAEIIDAIDENREKTISETCHAIKGLSDRMDLINQSIVTEALCSVENMSRMAATGQFSQIEKKLKKVFAGMSIEHPLYPEYEYTYDGDIFKSTPRSAKAKQVYPPRFDIKGTIRVGDRYFNDTTVDPMDYAYRHQLKLVISVKEAVKLLGNRIDPIQKEAERIIGKDIIATPSEFPESFPCSIKVGETTYFDYILLRIREILDDGTFVIGNQEQTESVIRIEIKINPENPEKDDMTFNITNADNHELLNYLRFIDELTHARNLQIYALNKKKNFISGNMDNINCKADLQFVPAEIDFLKRVCAIEDYFHVKMNIRGNVNEEEARCVFMISELIFNDIVESTWKEISLTGQYRTTFLRELEKAGDTIEMMSCVGICGVNLFGAKFEFKYMRTFKCAIMQESARIKRLMSCLEDGDPIKIKFVPGNDNRVFDTLQVPEKIELND